MFDVSQNRLSYSELLQPDFGYNLEFAVGLTYSLDLEALLGVPISLGLLDEMDTSLRDNPFYLLEAIRKSSDKLCIFCNAGGISLPQKIQSVYSLLENSVFEVKLTNRQNFHPKLWLIEYRNNEGQAYIKLIVLSRNLTFDNSLDLAFEFKGEVGKAKRNKNLPLYDLLNFVNEFSDKSKSQKITALAEDVLRVKNFDVTAPFDDYEFLPYGINKNRDDSLFEKCREVFVVSPFLSDDIVNELTKASGRKMLITRKTSITQNTFNRFDKVYITKDILTDNEFGVKQDIHAKLYFTTGYDGNFLYIGSANASHNAFYNNVEFLIKLKYAPYQVSYDQFINDFIPDENNPFEEITAISDLGGATEDDSAKKAIKEAIYAIKGARVILSSVNYDVEINVGNLKTEKKIKIAPLQKPNIFIPLQKPTLFKNLLLKELSEFYILCVDDEKVVIKIETKNIPHDRDDAVYKGIINSKNAFLSYVTFMLSDNYSESAYEQEQYLKLLDENTLNNESSVCYSAVYEIMLRAISRNPNKLNEIADVIKRLDKDIISDEFIEMYEQFQVVARRLKK